jgi:hypothetical protein
MVISDGAHATEVINVLRNDIPNPGSLESIREKAVRVLKQSVNPVGQVPEHPSDGLLYGLIQSGKTSIITVAAAMAADNGFRCILILTSDNDLIYDQTLERVRKALRGLTVLGKKDWKDAQRFERQLRASAFCVVCSKNGSKLKSLLEAFRAARADGLPTLIIDDEADQASLNTYTSKGGKQVSRINEVITEFRDFFPLNTYLQVTATPQALFLQRPDHRYRPSFTVLSEPGPGYVGGEAFFDSSGQLLRDVDLDEVDLLRTTHQPSPTGTIPPGLKQALCTFLVAATAKLIRNPNEEGYAFLCHVSVNQRDHKHIVDLIDRFREETVRVLQTPGSRKYQQLLDCLKEGHDDLAATEPDIPSFDQIVSKIQFYLQGATIRLVNAMTNEEVKLDSVYNIFVGGNKLGRGVTIKNLLVSYYGRNPKRPNSDTVLQHARMYGYRQKDSGLTRLFLPEKLAEHFRLIHQMESALRDLVQKHPQGKFEGLYISSPLQATRRNVLDPNAIGYYVAGRMYNPPYPLRTADIIKHTRSLDGKLTAYKNSLQGHPITVDFVIELLSECPPDPEKGIELWDPKTVITGLEKLRTVLGGNDARLIIQRGRNLRQPRRETQGIHDSGEDAHVAKDIPTLFMYRQNAHSDEVEVWWPQLRFPDGNYVLAFSFAR